MSLEMQFKQWETWNFYWYCNFISQSKF